MGYAQVTADQFSAAVSGWPDFPEESDELSAFLRYETLPGFARDDGHSQTRQIKSGAAR